MSIARWQVLVHELAKSKGWHPVAARTPGGGFDVNRCLVLMALIHTEISECVEALRDGEPTLRFGENRKPEGVGVELADAAIRIFDAAEAMGVDLEECIRLKHDYNKRRPKRHGGKLA